MSDNPTTTITITGDIRVRVPASSRCMTTFVLQEQNDWFEDEIKFIRHYIKPGMNVIDIGANYGLYTLALANIIGQTGNLWSFEPTRATAETLRSSIKENRFNNIMLIQSGLSDKVGMAELYTSSNSELNSLSKEAVPGDQHESIKLDTLDNCRHEYGWESIDFIKLDAEGEENNILKAGTEMLADLSPLIMFELKHVESVNLPLIYRFKEMGYNCYRLIPGLNVLVPFTTETPYDGYLLNLFCCKMDKAEMLEKEGIIVSNWGDIGDINNGVAIKYISDLPFYRSISNQLLRETEVKSSAYMEMLNLYVSSLSESSSSQYRASCLMSALHRVKDMLSKQQQCIEGLVVASRIAFDAGERFLGVKILSELVKWRRANRASEVEQLLLPASKRYEQVDTKNQVSSWLWSSVYEQYIVMHAFSSYFTRQASLPVYEQLSHLGFMSKEMSRRYQLVRSNFS